MTCLADEVAPLLAKWVPEAYANMTAASSEASSCRLGSGPPSTKPFSGMTAVLDYSAHPHKDVNNVEGGVTAVSI